MRQRLRALLLQAGLGEEEADIYLLALTLQTASVATLRAHTDLPRATVYRIVRRLQERGLIASERLNRRERIWKPLSLSALTKKLAAEERTLRRLSLSLQGLDRLVPFLDTEDDGVQEEGIQLREGIDAFREEYLKIPDACEREFLYLGSMPTYWNIAKMGYECAEERSFIARRLRRGIYCRLIDLPSPMMDAIQKNDSRERRSSMMVENIPIKKHYLAMTERYAAYFLCTPENPRVLLIKQPELLQLYKDHFAALWAGNAR